MACGARTLDLESSREEACCRSAVVGGYQIYWTELRPRNAWDSSAPSSIHMTSSPYFKYPWTPCESSHHIPEIRVSSA